MNKIVDLLASNYGTVSQHKYSLAILPWGATEPHNLHLPYLTDCILSHDVAVEAANEAINRHGIYSMVLPPVNFGAQNPGQYDLPFCIHTSIATQKAILTDIVKSLMAQGFNKLLIINGHGGNSLKGIVRDLAFDLPNFEIAISDWFKALPSKDYFDEPGDHADEIETSVMMHFHPELVDLSEAGEGRSTGFSAEALRRGIVWMPRNWSKVSSDTGIGNPYKSTAEKGRRYVADLTQIYADFIKDFTEGNIYKKV